LSERGELRDDFRDWLGLLIRDVEPRGPRQELLTHGPAAAREPAQQRSVEVGRRTASIRRREAKYVVPAARRRVRHARSLVAVAHETNAGDQAAVRSASPS
jgi:hypothetical protein